MFLQLIRWRAAIIVLAIGSWIGACSSNDPAGPSVTASAPPIHNEHAAAESSEATAIAAIKALGGRVDRDDKQPGSPIVAIDLIGLVELKDDDLRLLKPFTGLHELYLGNTATSDAGLKHLAGLKNLTLLGLIGTRVTDAGLKELLGLQNLEYLWLGSAPISDSGLEELAKLKNLKAVLLQSSLVTEAGLNELRKALPNLEIQGGAGGVRDAGVAGPGERSTGQRNTGQRTDPTFDVSVARPAYTQQHPSVFFDEAHQNFHTASGRYKVFADLITNDGYRVTPNQERLTAERLAGHNVLISANATTGSETIKSAFSEAECDAVQKWVEGGGSLLLITDHEPFGSASDELGRRFGVEMSLRVTFDPANESDRGLLFSRDKNQLGDHRIMQGRDKSELVSRVLTFTGQSLKGPPGSVGLLQFADTAKEREGRDGRGQEISAAGRAQGVALKYGRGRVVVMGEAAQLSAQVYGADPPIPMGMNVPGCDNRQMALNVMHWLTGLLD